MRAEKLYSEYASQNSSAIYNGSHHIDGHTDYHNDGAWEGNGYNFHTDTHNDIG